MPRGRRGRDRHPGPSGRSARLHAATPAVPRRRIWLRRIGADRPARTQPDLLEHRHRDGSCDSCRCCRACRSPTTSARRCCIRSSMTSTTLRGSPAHGIRSTAADLARFVAEDPHADADLCRHRDECHDHPRSPTSTASSRSSAASTPCPWGLGFEVQRRQEASLDRRNEFAKDVWTFRWGRYLRVGGSCRGGWLAWP